MIWASGWTWTATLFYLTVLELLIEPIPVTILFFSLVLWPVGEVIAWSV